MNCGTEPEQARRNTFRSLLRLRNFPLLWAAGALSAIGDQFDLIAFPWLVLLVTGDPLAVGVVLAVSSAPTVFFMLLGGSLVDRFSPLLIMLGSNAVRLTLAGVLAALILIGQAQLWIIYLFALVKGIADSLYYPAQGALIPRVVPSGLLRQSNATTHTTAELSGLIGPTFAGALIAFFSGDNGRADIVAQAGADGANLAGIGFAFAVVGTAFLISALILAFIRLAPLVADSESPSENGGILKSIAEGIRFVRADTAMFSIFLLIACTELLIEGPLIVGIPVLADTRLGQGALAMGVITSAYAGGALSGSILAGILPAPRKGMGAIFIGSFFLAGLLLSPFGFLSSMWLAAGIAIVIGVAGGYTDIMFTTWLQARTPQRMMGRVMSLLMIAAVGLSPISNAISGALIKLSLQWVFVGAGAALALLSLAVSLRPEVRNVTMPAGDTH